MVNIGEIFNKINEIISKESKHKIPAPTDRIKRITVNYELRSAEQYLGTIIQKVAEAKEADKADALVELLNKLTRFYRIRRQRFNFFDSRVTDICNILEEMALLKRREDAPLTLEETLTADMLLEVFSIPASTKKGADVYLAACSPYSLVENDEDSITKLFSLKDKFDCFEDKAGNTPLYYAFMQNDLRLLKQLFADPINANPNVKNSAGKSILYEAVVAEKIPAEKIPMVNLLIVQPGIDFSETYDSMNILLKAVSENWVDTVEALMKSERAKSLVNPEGGHNPPLHRAAVRGYSKIAAVLIKGGANIDAFNESKFTPLSLASNRGHLETVKIFLENKANLSILSDGKSALAWAVTNKMEAVVNFLIVQPGIDLSETYDSKNILQKAVSEGWVDTVEALMKIESAKSSINIEGNSDRPLHRASQKGFSKIAEVLIRNGGDINALSEKNCTPLAFASDRGHLETVKILLENNASLNMLSMGKSALAWAVLNKREAVVNFLILQPGIDLSETYDGKTIDVMIAEYAKGSSGTWSGAMDVLKKKRSAENSKIVELTMLNSQLQQQVAALRNENELLKASQASPVKKTYLTSSPNHHVEEAPIAPEGDRQPDAQFFSPMQPG